MIDSIDYGEIRISGRDYYSDVLVWWGGEVEYREKQHIFSLEDFLRILEKRPQVVVIGTGQEGSVRVPDRVKEMAEQTSIELFIEPSRRAVQLFNAFLKDGKKVVAYIHVTM
ncbi:MAG: hypothetical protein HY518_01525 [Candidatus Aenigmarchaeota archaeon]|nr:hypothetical protein [Candidatus Aenigmarchaeota archaeon]